MKLSQFQNKSRFKRKKNYDLLKSVITILVGLAAFIYVFHLDGQLINWVITQLSTGIHEWFGIIRIVLWCITFSTTFSVALLLGVGVAALVVFILTKRKGF